MYKSGAGDVIEATKTRRRRDAKKCCRGQSVAESYHTFFTITTRRLRGAERGTAPVGGDGPGFRRCVPSSRFPATAGNLFPIVGGDLGERARRASRDPERAELEVGLACETVVGRGLKPATAPTPTPTPAPAPAPAPAPTSNAGPSPEGVPESPGPARGASGT